MKDDEFLGGWAAAVDAVIRGEHPPQPSLKLGTTPELLQAYGLSSGILTMSTAKIAVCRKTHPHVTLDIWHNLPDLLADPLAIFPSVRRDGTMVILLLVKDRDGDPVLVAAIPSKLKGNVILSVYGKNAGYEWAAKEIAIAEAEGLRVYKKMDFAASLPQPPVAEATSSSHGLIPSDGTAKPIRSILKLREKSTKT